MAEKQVRIDLVANDKASGKIEDVADEVKDLEKHDEVEIEVEADTRKVERQLDEVSDDLKDLQKRDTEIVLTGKVQNLKAQLGEAEDALKKVQGKAEDTKRAVDDIGTTGGPRLAGNTVADLTGPLGDASGAASDLGGVFDGLADTAESAFLRMGASAATAGMISSALGGVGFAVAGIVAAFTYFSGQAKKAEEAQKKLVEGAREVRDALKEQRWGDAAQQLIDDYGDVYDAAAKFGISADDVTKAITGQTSEIPKLLALLKEHETRYRYMTTASGEARNEEMEHGAQLEELASKVDNANNSYVKANGSLDQQDARLHEVTESLRGAKTASSNLADAQDRVKRNTDKTKEAMDRLRGVLDMERVMLRFSTDFQNAHDKAVANIAFTAEEILSLKEDVLDVAEYADLNPVEVKSLLDRITMGDYLGVKTDVEAKAAANPVGVDSKLMTPSDLALQQWLATIQQRINRMGGRVYVPGGGFVQPGGTAATASVPVATVNVTQNVPRGYQGDVLVAAQTAAKRSGGLYQRNSK